MSSDDSVGAQTHELADQIKRPLLLISRISSLQNLVKNDEEFVPFVQQIYNPLQTLQFGKEIRFIIRKRIGGAQAGDQLAGTKSERPATDRSADTCQQIVHADGAQIGALAGHVRAGYNKEIRAGRYGRIILHALLLRHQRMSHFRSKETEGGVGQDGINIIRAVVGKRTQRTQRIKLSHRFQPVHHIPSVTLFPAFDAHNLLQLEEYASFKKDIKQLIVAQVQAVEFIREL